MNRSIGIDVRLWPFDVKLSKAWASALRQAGVLTTEEIDAIAVGLDKVADRLAAGEAPIDGVTHEELVTRIRARGHRDARVIDRPEALAPLIASRA
ncbi:MAG: hypothetical protein ACLGIK_09620, partial [Gemmatimonadota bacterium]